MIRVQILSLAVFGVLASGCYDNGTKEDCVGLSCGPGLDWPDGGETSIRYVRYPDGSEWRAFIGFFVDQQTPDQITMGALNVCSTETPWNAEMRHFYDVGPSITFHMGSEAITVPKVSENAVDFTTRTFDVAYLLESWDPVDEDFFNNSHSVTADDGSMPVTIDRIYMPPKLDITNPMPEGPSNFISIKKGQDLVVEWAEQEPVPPEISTAAAIIFNDVTMAAYPMVCVGLNSGRYVVPKAIIDQIPRNGLLQAGTIANEAVLTPDGRRIDTWGTNCQAIPYTLVD